MVFSIWFQIQQLYPGDETRIKEIIVNDISDGEEWSFHSTETSYLEIISEKWLHFWKVKSTYNISLKMFILSGMNERFREK